MEEQAIVSSLRQLCLRRPKERLAKAICQDIESHLPRLVQEASLSHTLVTVLPDPTADLMTSWRAVRDVRDSILLLVERLPGMCFSILALEVHGGSRPKKRPAPVTPAATTEEEPEAMDLAAEEDEAPPAEDEARPGPKGMQGKPHFHLLIYYPAQSAPALDPSYAKRELKKIFPLSDINQVHQRTSKKGDGRQRIVGAMTYVLKGVDCPVKTSILQLIHPGLPVLNPILRLGNGFLLGSTPGTILRAMLRATSPTIEHDLALEADVICGSTFENPSHKLAQETKALLIVAARVRELGYRISGDGYYRVIPGTRFTWARVGDHNSLLHTLSAEDSIFLDYIVRYSGKIRGWMNLAPFPSLPTIARYSWIELRDAVYCLRSGEYVDKDVFGQSSDICFRYYNINVYRAITTEPTEWLKLIRYAHAINANPQDEMDAFLAEMGKLLRPRLPKQRIMFILGCSNSGKSTAIAWITRLYPPDAVCTINDSVAPLSAVKGRQILVMDEFATHKISRSLLLLLCDGTNGLTVRSFGREAEYITDVDLPQVYTANIGHEPQYKGDESGAIYNRFRFFRWERQILTPDSAVAKKIFEETPFIVFYLNRLNNKENI